VLGAGRKGNQESGGCEQEQYLAVSHRPSSSPDWTILRLQRFQGNE